MPTVHLKQSVAFRALIQRLISAPSLRQSLYPVVYPYLVEICVAGGFRRDIIEIITDLSSYRNYGVGAEHLEKNGGGELVPFMMNLHEMVNLAPFRAPFGAHLGWLIFRSSPNLPTHAY